MKLNRMCTSCRCLGTDCAGTTESVWTNCIYRKSANGDADLSPSIPIIPRETMLEHGVLISKLGEATK